MFDTKRLPLNIYNIENNYMYKNTLNTTHIHSLNSQPQPYNSYFQVLSNNKLKEQKEMELSFGR